MIFAAVAVGWLLAGGFLVAVIGRAVAHADSLQPHR